MNELSEFFKTVSIEKTRVAEERKRFNQESKSKKPIYQTFLARLKQKQNQVVLAQREGTKLDALQTFLLDFKLLKIVYKNKLKNKNKKYQRWF